MKNDSFYTYHPVVNLGYFVSVIGFSMFFMHPVFLGISLFCGAVYALYIRGRSALRVGLLYMLPLVLITAVLNPLFNHQGATILGYLRNGNPVTLESITFGIATAIMLVAVIIWFACFNMVMSGDKFVYLFGRVIPSLALVLSMAIAMVPKFRTQLGIIANAQKTTSPHNKNRLHITTKAKNGIKILSILITWALENSIQTADSMKARGYGLKGRTAFSIYRFTSRDIYALFFIAFCVVAILIGASLGIYQFRYFPTISGTWSGWALAIFVTYFALCFFPITINIAEDIKWKHLQSKT